MSHVAIRRVPKLEDRSLPVFEELERVLDDVRRRALQIFESRTLPGERALDDWLQAEHELCWPAAELVEHEKDYGVSFALPGFEPDEIELTVTPREVIVHGRARHGERKEQEAVCWSEFRGNDVYRRTELPAEIDAEKVSATYRNGLLKIVAPKAVRTIRKVPVASAA